MLPSDNTSPTRELGILPYLYPGNLNTTANSRQWHARGGVDIGVGAAGLNVQNWIFYLWSYGIWAAKGTQPMFNSGNFLYEIPVKGILSLSGAFDRNMNPNIAWTTEEGAYFRWYDTAQEDYTITHFPGVQSILLAHDDVRDSSQADSDVIVTWVEDGRIYYAIQRERYTITKEVEVEFPGKVIRLHNFGMTGGYRLQWEYSYGTD